MAAFDVTYCKLMARCAEREASVLHTSWGFLWALGGRADTQSGGGLNYRMHLTRYAHGGTRDLSGMKAHKSPNTIVTALLRSPIKPTRLLVPTENDDLRAIHGS